MKEGMILLFILIFLPVLASANTPINILVNMNTINITTSNTSDEIQSAVNGTGYYDITSQMCYYVNNATERSLFTSTYNASYEAGGNSSWNQSLADSLYYPLGNPTGYITGFTELDPYYRSNPNGYYNSTTLPYFINNTFNSSYVPYTGANDNVDLGAFNFTTTGYGYFGNLNVSDISFFGDLKPMTTLTNDIGSGESRWNYLWVRNIDAEDINTNNITADYFIGDGSLLTGITESSGNTTAEMQNAVNNSGYYNITSQMCYYIDNATEREAFASTYNITYDQLTSDNATWNEARANSLYWKNATNTSYEYFLNTTLNAWINWAYNKSNPMGFYNITTFPFYNNLSTDDFPYYINLSIDDVNTTDFYQVKVDWDNVLNPPELGGDNASWNETYADTKYEVIGSGGNASWNETYANSLYYPIDNPFAFINDTTWQYNQTTPAVDYCDETFITLANEGNLNVNSSTYWDNLDAFPTLYEANISDLQSYLLSEGDPAWNNNYTAFNASWSDTHNATYDTVNSWYYNKSNPMSFYNSTTFPFYNNLSNSTLLTYNATYNTWAYNMTTPAINWVKTNSLGFYNSSTVLNNITGNTTNEMFAACNNNTFSLITEPYWAANYSAFNVSWSSTYNSTYNGMIGHNTSVEIQAAMNNTATSFNISLTYPNDSKIYFGSQKQFCMFYNSTLNALVSTNVC